MQLNVSFPQITGPLVAVAVSGGADSFALLNLARLWAREHKLQIMAFTVDHRLRPENAVEAEIVGRWCQDEGITHQTLVWSAPKPPAGIQEAARIMRRELLLNRCHADGITALFLGHQADDQAETMLMRLQRGTGLGGLEAMQDEVMDIKTGITIYRPLLKIRRSALRQHCLENNLPFIDDPSNNDRAFERVRMRNTLAELPKLAGGVAKTALRLRRANDTLNHLAQTWLEAHRQSPEVGHFWIPATWCAELPEIQLRILHILLSAIKRQRLSVDKLEKLALHMNDPGFGGSNIASCWARPKVISKIPGFLFSAEPPRKA